MAKPPKKPPTQQALALASAITKSQLTQLAIANHMDVTPALVGQWARGLRPVPAAKARRLADLLGIPDPRRISAGYADVANGEGTVVPLRKLEGEEPLRPDLVIARLQNDVDALRYAVAALISVMPRHRPAEVRDVVKAIRQTVPAHFRNQGFVAALLAALEPDEAKG